MRKLMPSSGLLRRQSALSRARPVWLTPAPPAASSASSAACVPGGRGYLAAAAGSVQVPSLSRRAHETSRMQYRILPFAAGRVCSPPAWDRTEVVSALKAVDEAPGTDFDGHWKDALETLLEPCVALFWPTLHADIDWARAPDFLDKELRALAPGRRRSRRYLDKLVRVYLKSGEPTLMLLHLEIQQRLASHFARRMYGYFARIQERFPADAILQFAIITRSRRQADALHYHYAPKGQDFLSLSYRVPVVHLQDWAGQEHELRRLAPGNPFAIVILAELAAARRSAPQTRLEEKKQLVRSLYDYGWPPKRIRQLFIFIDGILALPASLDEDFWQSLASFEEERNMAYISSVERIGIRKGLEQGRNEGMAFLLREQLESRFGALSAEDRMRLSQADGSSLRVWARRLLNAKTLESIWQ
ncbi:Transposase/invertase (TIGR01784 family) [Kerstersia similis]